MVNSKLLLDTIDWIEQNPTHWNQGSWHCGTTHCFKGVAEMLEAELCPAEEFLGEGLDPQAFGRLVLGLSTLQVDLLFFPDRSLLQLRTLVEILQELQAKPTCFNRGM
jgi:hypothetical protein